MICPHCSGKGRIIASTLFGQGHKPPIEIPEIGMCPKCQGSGVEYCCDGAGENYGEQRAEIMIELAPELLSEVNPNDSEC